MIKRVALYSRVSTRKDKRDSPEQRARKRQDNENQLIQLREFCERSGWVIVQEYSDTLTATNSKRPQFQGMLADAAQRRFDAVCCWALDRMTRGGVADTFEHIKLLLGHGVQFISFTEPHFRTTGPAGELMIAMAAWIAQQESIRMSERTLAGLARARKAGATFGRPRLVVDKTRIQEMQKAGHSLAAIAARLKVSKSTVARVS
jgi:DNA invertase Pin-like site-specific DNA recombinase